MGLGVSAWKEGAVEVEDGLGFVVLGRGVGGVQVRDVEGLEGWGWLVVMKEL